MSDVKCPYCGDEQEINHDDGYGYDEGEKHEQQCWNCEKTFNFTTCVSYDYEVFCTDNLCDFDSCEVDLSRGKGIFYNCKNCDNTKLEMIKPLTNKE